MFHECRVYNGNGELKTTYTKEQVSIAHWGNVAEGNNQFTFSETGDIPPGLVKGSRRTVICAFSGCKKSVTTTHRRTKVCSDKCGRQIKRDKDATRRRAKSNNSNFKPPQEFENGFFGYKIKCKQCNETAYKRNYRAMFCSPKCLNRHKNLTYVSKKKHPTYSIVCKSCNEKADMKSSYAQYCSAKCRNIERAKRKNTTAKTW